MLALHTAYASETGQRPRNEDSCGYWTSQQGCCWVVSDGAGGHGGGDKASQLVVNTMLTQFAKSPEVSNDNAVLLLETANNAVVAAKRANSGGDDMHATATVLLIDPEMRRAVWGHVGDTRVYMFREGKIVYQTKDHTLIQNMIDAGYGTPSMIRGHPQRSLLTSAIGDANELSISVSGKPVSVHDGDIFLICTDGWWETIEERDMEATLARAGTAKDWIVQMADQVTKRAGNHGDNYTAVVVQARETDSMTTVIRPSK